MKNLTVSVVIPCFNEAGGIEQALENVLALKPQPEEIIVVEGGGCKDTIAKVNQLRAESVPNQIPISLIESDKTDRGTQMNRGATASKADLICFLHADTQPPANLIEKVQFTLGQSDVAICALQSKYQVRGRLEPVFTSLNFLKTFFIPLIFFPRLFLLQGFRLFFGDQLICCHKSVWQAVQGFREGGLMEDSYFCLAVAQAKLGSAKLLLRSYVTTSGRRCETRGFWSCLITYLHLTLRWALRQPVDQWKDRY